MKWGVGVMELVSRKAYSLSRLESEVGQRCTSMVKSKERTMKLASRAPRASAIFEA